MVSKKLEIIFLSLLYNASLLLSILKILSYFSYVEGYGINYRPEWPELLFSLFLSTSLVLFLPLNINKPSSLFLWIVYLTHASSAILTNPFKIHSYIALILIWLEFAILLFLFIIFPFKVNIKPLLSENKIRYLLLFSLGIGIILMILKFGFNFNIPSIISVYEVREVFKEKIQSLAISWGYLILGYSFSISPLSLLLGLKEAKNFLSIFLIAGSILWSLLVYSNAGFKSVAFANIVVGTVYLYARKNLLKTANQIVLLILTMLSLMYLLSFTSNIFQFIYFHLFRRTFIVPGMNVNYFFDLMTEHYPIWSKEFPLLVSKIYYGTTGSANTGFLGDSFSKLFPIGYILNTLIIIFLFKLLDSITDRYNRTLMLPMVVIYSYLFSNSATTTVIISYGFWILIFIFLLTKWR